jgi:peptidyl-prolyl cis-trans isomerase D
MFDAVRNNKRIAQVILVLIAITFSVWGVESYIRDSGSANMLATVGDTKITQQEFQQAMREQQEQMREALGPNFNPAMLDSPAVRRSMLEQLVNQRLLLIEAARRKIVVGDEMLREFIASAPPFQVGGKFSMERYQAFVSAQGKSQQGFEHELRQDLVLRQFATAVGQSGIVAGSVLARIQTAMAEKRTVQELRITPDAYLRSVTATDEDIQKYYETNRREFEEPEQVRAEFVVLSMDSVMAQTKVSDAEVKARYENLKDKYKGQEERRASHILIQADPGNAGERAAAKTRAEQILAQVKARPADFAKLAKANSQDPGSAAEGGDLGFFGRGAMVKPFEDAAFALKEKEISGVVETEHGYHVILLTGSRTSKGRTFDEVKGEIEAELKQQSAQKVFAEAAEAFVNMVYEQSDSLKPVVERFKLPVQQTNWMIKGAPVMPGTPFANPRLAAAIFSEDAVKNKRNTEAVEVQANTLVSARVAEHKPAALKPLDTVKVAIRDKLMRLQASGLATKAGEAKLAELKQGKDSGNAWGAAKAVSRTQPAGLSPDALKSVFKISGAPGYAGVPHPAGGYALYKLMAVDAGGALDARVAEQLNSEVREAVAQEEMNAFLSALRTRHKVVINASALESKAQ